MIIVICRYSLQIHICKKYIIILIRFTNRDSIILHRKQHTKQKTHFCSICNKGFYKQSCLSRHQRSHTGERPFQCEFCKKSFSQSTSVKAHKAKCSLNPDYDESIMSQYYNPLYQIISYFSSSKSNEFDIDMYHNNNMK